MDMIIITNGKVRGNMVSTISLEVLLPKTHLE